MALECETGTATKITTGGNGGTQDITVGHDPKAFIIWGTKNRTSQGLGAGTNCASIGFCDDADNNVSIAMQNEDNSGNVEARKEGRTDAVLIFLTDSTAAETARASMTLGTLKATLTWDLQDGSIATLLHWISYGGADITGVQVFTITKVTDAAPVVQSITLDADCQGASDEQAVLFAINIGAAGSASISNNFTFNMGMATSSDKEGVATASGDDNSSTGEYRQGFFGGHVMEKRGPTSGTANYTGEFNGWDSLGFDINWSVNDATAGLIYCLVIKGGKWEVDSGRTMPTSNGDKVYSTSFQPKGLMTLAVRRTTTGQAREDSTFNLGAASSTTTETWMGFTAEDVSDPMNVGHGSSNVNVIEIMNAVDQSIDGRGIVDSFNATDFTLEHFDAGTAWLFASLVCGDADVVAFNNNQGQIIG